MGRQWRGRWRLDDDDATPPLPPAQLSSRTEELRFKQSDRQTDSRAVQPISHQIRLTSCSLLPLPLSTSQPGSGLDLGSGLHLRAADREGCGGREGRVFHILFSYCRQTLFTRTALQRKCIRCRIRTRIRDCIRVFVFSHGSRANWGCLDARLVESRCQTAAKTEWFNNECSVAPLPTLHRAVQILSMSVCA